MSTSDIQSKGFVSKYIFWGYTHVLVRLFIVVCWLIVIVPTFFLLSGVVGYVLYDSGYYDAGLIEKHHETASETCISYYDLKTNHLKHTSCEKK